MNIFSGDKDMKRINSLTMILAIMAIVGFAISGCKKEEGGLKFNHQLHVVDNEMKCSDCHSAGKDGKMENPDMDKCSECHDIDVDHPSDDCLMCHTLKSSMNDYSVEESVPEKPKGYVDLLFTHEAHEDVECNTCHKGIDKQESLSELEWPDMFTCKKCHNGEEAPIDCEVCHTKVRKEIPPESHHGDWAMQHGPASRFDKSCEFCHDNPKRFCNDCHQTQKPKDHIFNWKTTQHGQDATHDRRLCAVCHPASYCSDCHRSQKPVSHSRGDWMAYTRENGHAEAAKRNFRSCNVCHTTSECRECHQNVILRK